MLTKHSNYLPSVTSEPPAMTATMGDGVILTIVYVTDSTAGSDGSILNVCHQTTTVSRDNNVIQQLNMQQGLLTN